MVTLESLNESVNYIKESIDDIKEMWKDHEKRIQQLERSTAVDRGYSKGLSESSSIAYKREKLWLGILSLTTAILAVIVAIRN